MKSIIILQIIFDVILIILNGYLGFNDQSIYLLAALLWCICLWLHILTLNTFEQGEKMKYLGFEEVKSELVRLKKENEELKKEIKQLKEDIKNLAEKISIKTFVDNIKPPKPMPVVYGCPVGEIGKNGLTKEEIVGNKGLEKSIASILNGEEHKCTPECFEKHVIKAIQNDYDSIDSKNRVAKYLFVNYWYDNLLAFYPWLKRLYSINGKIRFK